MLALIVYLFALAMIRLVVLRQGQPADLSEETLSLVALVPLTAAVIYFLAVFTFGLSGDIAACQSMYPARMFTLPVPTAALAGWPMLYGSAAMAILWFATRVLGVWPSHIEVPIVWPALLAASLLAWTQALAWMPYPLPGLRVAVMVLWLAAIPPAIIQALHHNTPESVMLTILAPHVPLAYLVARFAVRRARCGDVADWRRQLFSRRGRIADFRSPASAQVWFEWRQYGRSLPSLVAILLPFELALLFIFRGTPGLVVETLVFVLCTPPFMAAFVAASVRAPSTPFTSMRPLTSMSLIAAKLKATIWSTLATWLLVLVAIPVALRLTGTSLLVSERAHQLADIIGTPRAVALAVLGLFALLASTWKQLAQSLYIGMSGREWMVKASVFLAVAFLAVVLPLAHGISGNRSALAVLWTALPRIAAVLVCIKLCLAGWIAVRLHDRRLLSDRALVISAVCWDILVFALYAVLVWIVPDLLIGRYVLALVAILEIPLARVAAAPLAVAWNRHR